MRPVSIWQYPEWPHFTWNEVALQTQLASVRYTSRPTGTCRTRNSQSGRLWRQKH
ncbi:MAG: DUF4172 domain-containing protein [Paludibacteraceae bacterium]|nr:DUF4172 domain-containing protein [Paludibacteraceae bacterium]